MDQSSNNMGVSPTTSLAMLSEMNENEFPHLMIDTETMGRCPGAVPFALAAVPFSVEESTMGDPMLVHIDFKDALGHDGLCIEASTTAFWMEKGNHWTRMQQNTVALDSALAYLSLFYERQCSEGARAWARGGDFDFGFILRPCYDAVGRDLPWEYYNQRDQRTLGYERPEHSHQHDPVADAVEQAKQMIEGPQEVHDLLAS